MDPRVIDGRHRVLAADKEGTSDERASHTRRLLQLLKLAAASLFTCAPLLFARRPQTPLRVLCISAFDYAARLDGSKLDRARRTALACACDFGAMRNDFYDQRELNPEAYRELRRNMRQLVPQAATRDYIRDLRDVERGRPVFEVGGFSKPEAVIEYRTRVLAVSLAWLQSISRRSLEPVMFEAFLALVGLLQVVDDLIDWRDDWVSRRPTYVTAFLREWTPPPRQAVIHLRAHADHFRRSLVAASDRRLEIAPLSLAGGVVWLTAMVLMRMRFPE
jgi:hypothetical protein